MTAFELNKIFRSWLLEAQIDPTGLSVHAMRHSVIVRFIRAMTESAQANETNLVGRIPAEMSSQYKYSSFLKTSA